MGRGNIGSVLEFTDGEDSAGRVARKPGKVFLKKVGGPAVRSQALGPAGCGKSIFCAAV